MEWNAVIVVCRPPVQIIAVGIYPASDIEVEHYGDVGVDVDGGQGDVEQADNHRFLDLLPSTRYLVSWEWGR